MDAQRLVLLRVHQRDAGLDVREALAERALAARGPDLLVLATCHRVECYGVAPAGRDPHDWIAERVGVAAAEARDARSSSGDEAALHLMRVVAGLDSLVPGEGQILGQLRRAYDEARASGLDPLLGELARAALRLGRTARVATALGRVRRSIGSLAVDAGVAHLADARRATALVIGAGEIGKLAARALAHRVGTLVIANRNPEHAREAAALSGARVAPLSAVPGELAAADLVISAADTRGGVLTEAVLERRLAAGPLVLVDIAVPRSVPAADRALPGLRYLSVDDLHGDAGTIDAATLAEVEARCRAAAVEFARGRHARTASATIETLHARGARVRERQLERALTKLRHLPLRDRAIVAALADGLTKSLLHAPTVALRDDPSLAEPVRRLFALSEQP